MEGLKEIDVKKLKILLKKSKKKMWVHFKFQSIINLI